ncbi:10 TM acyl transferase domain found in Cas1p-domain-containing protein [Hypoxylon sp. FL1284]|nr:10 TM acyl transferase domain found in Cas1p-domain-containing protein [Hypoxylon sp. FL1284]
MRQLHLPAYRPNPAKAITIVASIAVALVVILQRYLYYSSPARDDPYRCQALLRDRAWSPAVPVDSRKPEPTDCLTVEYSEDGDSLQPCLRGRRIVFVGDSTIRQVFLAATERFHDQARSGFEDLKTDDLFENGELHKDFSFTGEDIKFEFIWDPWLNSTSLFGVLKASGNEEQSSAAIILGSPGLWAARYGDDDYFGLFERGIGSIEPHISINLDENIPLSTSDTGTPNSISTKVLLAPVSIPEYNRLSPERSMTITPRRIDEMNSYLAALPPDQNSHIMWVYHQISTDEPPEVRKPDGLHDSKEMAARKLDVVLNVACNTASKAAKRTFKGTCCAAGTRKINPLFDFAILAWAVLTVCLNPTVFPFTMPHRTLREVKVIGAVRTILFVLAWCWYCDGSRFVGKAERHYQQGSFIKHSIVWLIVCLLSAADKTQPVEARSPLDDRATSSSGSSGRLLSDETNESDRWERPGYRGPGYLSRDHTDEIKGLMQGFVLLYHYHYASQTLWVYKIVRVFISGYLYLTGYGHTLYLLRTSDFSLRRVISVLLRINLLPALLPHLMGTKIDVYYFGPVASFWFLVVWLVAFVLHYRGVNDRPGVFLFKAFVVALATEWLSEVPGAFRSFAVVAAAICNADIDAEELRFRTSVDRYIVYVGMAVACLVHAASRRRTAPVAATAAPRVRFALLTRFSPQRRLRYFRVACGVVLVVYFVVTQWHPVLAEKHAYNRKHPFVSWIPVLCYVALRPVAARTSAVLRLPAALGRISLETYVLQYHIWLGRDATALLDLGLGARWGSRGRAAEVVLFSAAFLSLATLAHRAVEVLARRVTPPYFFGTALVLWLVNLNFVWWCLATLVSLVQNVFHPLTEISLRG